MLPAKIYDGLETELVPLVVNSFDCARFSMGVAQITLDPFVVLPKIRLRGSPEEQVAHLEAHAAHLAACIDNLVMTTYIGVWNLASGDKEAVKDAWEVAPPLRRKLGKFDAKFGMADTLLYEFQMGANDKSRMVSTMLAYHYSALQTVRIPPAVKNLMCMARQVDRTAFSARCPRISARRIKSPRTGKMTTVADLIYGTDGAVIKKDLSIQTFLAIVTDTYKANKMHTSACLEWWASLFPVDMQYVPKDCLDDAADAFMQTLGALRKSLL